MKKDIDYKLFFSVIILIVLWMIMVSSVSVYWSFKVTDTMVKAWRIDEAYNYFYVIRNISHILIAWIILSFLVKLKYSFFEKHAKHIFWLNVILLIAVLFIWTELKWATWWIKLPWIPFTIQPAEFWKFSLIIMLAYFLKKYHAYLWDFKKWFLPFFWIVGIVLWLLALQPDFWMILVTLPVAVIMYFYAWMNIKHLMVTVLIWMTIVLWAYNLWKYDKSIPEDRKKLSYITDRIDNFLSDNEDAIKNKTINYQTEQWLIAIWSWWFTGRWFWWSIQKFWYLPEVQWDFIFAVLIEELGFIGWLWLLLIYMYIWYRWLYIANRVKDKFWKYVAVWVSSRILFQACINIWVNLNIIPLTWVTLPFISYWWSSLLSLIIWLWVLLSISRDVEDKWNFSRVNKNKIMF
jgi:cell division protein FtsW